MIQHICAAKSIFDLPPVDIDVTGLTRIRYRQPMLLLLGIQSYRTAYETTQNRRALGKAKAKLQGDPSWGNNLRVFGNPSSAVRFAAVETAYDEKR